MSDWRSIKTAPKDGTKIDIWMTVHASPLSFGMSDAWRIIDVYYRDEAWFHFWEGREQELNEYYITHWMPAPKPPKARKVAA